MIKKLVKPETVDTQEEKVIPFSEESCNSKNRFYADEEIDDITF